MRFRGEVFIIGVCHAEAMSYHKYGLVKERLVRMRDRSVVVERCFNSYEYYLVYIDVNELEVRRKKL